MIIDPYPNYPYSDYKQSTRDSYDPVDIETWSDNRTCFCSIPVEKRHCKESLLMSVDPQICVVKEYTRCQLTATKVPGRKRMVRTAIVFIAELSRLAAFARALELFATCRFRTLSRCAIRL